MSGLIAEEWRLAAIILAAALVSDAWRFAGALIAVRIDEGSVAFRLVRAVATALIGAVIARLALFPTGALAELSLALRLAALAAGFATLLVTRQSLVISLAVGEAVLVIGALVG